MARKKKRKRVRAEGRPPGAVRSSPPDSAVGTSRFLDLAAPRSPLEPPAVAPTPTDSSVGRPASPLTATVQLLDERGLPIVSELARVAASESLPVAKLEGALEVL